MRLLTTSMLKSTPQSPLEGLPSFPPHSYHQPFTSLEDTSLLLLKISFSEYMPTFSIETPFGGNSNVKNITLSPHSPLGQAVLIRSPSLVSQPNNLPPCYGSSTTPIMDFTIPLMKNGLKSQRQQDT